MKWLMSLRATFLAKPMRRQMVALVVGAQLLAHGSTIVIVSNLLTRSDRIEGVWVELSDAFLTTLAGLDGTQDAEALLAPILARDARFSRVPTAPITLDPATPIVAAIRAELPERWRTRVEVVERPEDGAFPIGIDREPFALIADLGDGTSLWFVPNTGVVSRNAPVVAATLTVFFLAVPLTFLAIWSGAYIIRPVEALADGAKRFARDARTDLLPEEGPREVRSATRAFNAMQERLRQHIDERAQTLASIGHDLRTPLTRLGLRLEEVDLGEAKAGTLRDIATMEALINDALEFLRTESKPLELGPLDLASLCEAVVSEAADRGDDVVFPETPPVTLVCDANLTQRALTNLVDNAIKYAGSAVVSVAESNGAVTITVADEGPGIPADMLELVKKPFNRLETTAAGAAEPTRGFGLGLAIAEECMTRQGGALRLSANSPSGLIAVLHMPQNP